METAVKSVDGLELLESPEQNRHSKFDPDYVPAILRRTKLAVRPEIEILLCCARAHIDATTRARLETLLRQSPNWDVIFTAAKHHGLMPLLYWHLSQLFTFEAVVPAHVLDEFEREFQENAARCFFLTHELLEVVAELNREKIAVAAYKGPALAVLAYENLLLRSFCDLDLLIEVRDLDHVHRILKARGYEKQFHSNHDSNEYAHSFVRCQQDGSCVVIEVHWSITPRNFALPPHPPGALQRLIRVPLVQSEVRTLCAEDQLLVLCWHGYKHHWARLEWISCIAEIVRRDSHNFASYNNKITNSRREETSEQPLALDINESHKNGSESTLASVAALDWKHVLRLANQAGSRRLLLCGLGLASSLYDVELPPIIQNALQQDRVLPDLLRALQSGLVNWESDDFEAKSLIPGSRRNSEASSLRFFHLNSRERLRDKIRYSWRTLISPGQMDWSSLIPARWSAPKAKR